MKPERTPVAAITSGTDCLERLNTWVEIVDADALKVAQLMRRLDTYYHTFDHAMVVASQCAKMAESYGLSANGTLELLLAALWHDVVYVPGRKGQIDNETESAMVFAKESLLSRHEHFPQASRTFSRIQEMILDTRHKYPPRSFLGALLCDADLGAGLIGTHQEYALNCERIYREYSDAGVTDLQWLQGRLSFLDTMLSRERIFWTSWWAKGGQYSAVANMMAEQDALRGL
jgi:predicted metal-dependent HD superfamily phosphohydrolase